MAHIHSNALIGASGAAGAGDDAYIIPKSLRFNSGDSASLSRTVPNITTFSFSFWYKHVAITRNDIFVTDSSYGFFFYQHTDGSFRLNNNTTNLFVSNGLYRDPSAWYHLLLTNDGTTLKLYVNGVLDKAQTVGTLLNAGGIYIGRDRASANNYGDFLLADAQFVDGQALTPTDFGETRSSDGVWVAKEASFTSPNNGTVWSAGITGSALSNYPATNGFDGNTSTYFYAAANQTTNFTFSPAITGTTFEIYMYGGGSFPAVTVNGTNAGTASGAWVNVSSQAGGSLSTIACVGASSSQAGFSAVRVDGVILVDGAGLYGKNGFHLNFSDSSTNEALGFDSAPTITLDPKKGMDVVTYSGNGSLQNIGGLQFEPGLVWLKTRTGHNSKSHGWFDVVRGPTKFLASDSSAAENSSYDNNLTSFNPDGFTLREEPDFNTGGRTYVGWCWRAGGPAVANTAGTINSQVSANTDYGFSIATYSTTGSAGTIAHGLTNQTPKFIITKQTNGTTGWYCYHASLGATKNIRLDTTSAAGTASSIWNDTAPTTSLFSVGNGFGNGEDYVAYIWSEVSGYSKFGSWTGSGSASGNKVTTGFRPRFLMWKRTDTADNWAIIDSERSTSNPRNEWLGPFSSDAAGSNAAYAVDFLDDGFELKATHVATNASGGNYIYMCFADRPGNNWDVNNLVTNEGLSTSKNNFDVVTYTGNGGSQKIGGPVHSDNTTATGGFNSSYPATNLFNGTLSDSSRAEGNNNDGVIEVVFSPGIAVSSTVGIWSGKSSVAYQINDSGSYTTYNDAVGSFKDISFTGTLTNLKIKHGSSGQAPGASGIRVDGTTLIDGTGPGLKFQPDFLWIKSRSNSEGYYIANSVNGLTKNMRSNSASAEQTNANGVTAADANGFTLGNSGRVNGSSQTYVAWCWKAGGTAVSNTDGSVTSSVSANAAHGFSVVTWTGTGANATIGHGLAGKVPKFIILKARNATAHWQVFHTAVPNNKFLELSSNGGPYTNPDVWNSTNPTGSVFSVISGSNASNTNYVAYCFADVPGYQRFGTYYSNSSDPVVITGFKPRFLLVRKSEGSGNWMVLDSQRSNDDNDIRTTFEVNNSNGEETHANRQVKFLDNGFQLIGADMDTSDTNWLYWAIGDDEIGSDEDCLVDVPNAVTADADETDTTGGYQRGNYAVLNPLDTKLVHSNGNLDATSSSSQTWVTGRATVSMPSGKFYWEVTVNTVSHTNQNTIQLGVSALSAPLAANDAYQDSSSWVYANYSQEKANGGSASSYGARYLAGDTVGVAFDADNGTLAFYVNGVSQGVAYTGLDTSLNFGPVITLGRGGTATSISANFGQMRFKYPMPSGYAALNTTALPAATIPDGSAHFDTKLYTGNGGTNTITGLEFSPDWTWIKKRNSTSYHSIHDSVRGATKRIRSESNSAETTETTALTAFTSDGFTLGSGGTANGNNDSFVSWNWNAGSSTANNTDGSVTASVRANQTAGFSICTFTSPSSGNFTFGHGLNAVPEFVLVKTRGATSDWSVYHKSVSTTTSKYLILNTAIATDTYNYVWGAALPTTSVVGLTSGGAVATSQTCVAYCFTPVAGYSAFGSYEGNGSSDGPFVHTGFAPAFLIIKNADSTGYNWMIMDSARDTDNPRELYLNTNTTNAEDSTSVIEVDFLSNGFKVNDTWNGFNGSGDTMIYLAFAENPFQANGGLAR